jgi:hypothetical protein
MKACVVTVLGLAMVGCSSLQPVREPAHFITQTKPAVVYVTHRSRAVLVIAHPRISGDTVHGTWPDQPRPIAVPLSQVQSIEAVRRDGKRTAMLVAGLTILSGVGVYALVQNANGRDDWTCDYNTAVPRCG